MVLHSEYEELLLAGGATPDDKENTAFSVGQGFWQITVMSFGLCNAQATFQRLMEAIFRSLTYESCLVCLDNVTVNGCAFW
jgi:hypothetical protein